MTGRLRHERLDPVLVASVEEGGCHLCLLHVLTKYRACDIRFYFFGLQRFG